MAMAGATSGSEQTEDNLSASNGTGTLKVKVWDGYIRIFHWMLLVSIVVSFVSVRLDKMDVHFISGHVVLGLLIFRILWGLYGSRTALFKTFIKGPISVLNYLKDPDSEPFKPMIGHSPVAALSVIAMIVVIGVQVSTGLISDDEILLQGPLAQYVPWEWTSFANWFHALNAKFIMALAVLHLAAIAFYYFVKKDNLVKPMIVGDKAIEAKDAKKVPNFNARSGLVAAVTIVISIASAYFVFNL
jgi:cytochrome b